MKHHVGKSRSGLAATLAVTLAVVGATAMPALADVRAGVDAWSRGDYATAVAEWEGPAAAGDPDAMFNLGQAYRLGRGVAQDAARAEQLYQRAAQGGHLQAADTYGLMLFQSGRHAEAMPYVQDAARRGDPRSQYLLGIAHFNGDQVPQDWVRAYALLTLANGAGLPQAASGLAEMDRHVALADRQAAASLAEQLRAEADAARSAELAAADLGTNPAPAVGPVASAAGAPQASSRVPRPIATTAVSPSVAAARSAIAEARSATGTENPGEAGASYTQPQQAAPAPAAAPVVVAAAPTPTPAPTRAPTPAPAPASRTAGGPWKVQLGAFSVSGNAERAWAAVANRPEIAGHERLLVPAGRVTRLLAGGYASQAEAQAACSALQRAGHDCLVTRN